ncbi:ATP-binding protein [Paracnuella aquatica]|uniref:ATP-binding protein n=1 Tax=Paracnuella aquatica TaxID=2268757 RepID=UPI000DF01AD4|nr:ATP-binding protein [Paracnuella aquatica]RPD46533.1 response regulator [Paracnuella aquatica]
MRNRQFISIALAGFLIGVVLIVLLQVLSGQNIKRLIDGNNNLQQELHIRNELRQIQTTIVTLESDVRGAVISGDGVFVNNITASLARLDTQLVSIERLLGIPGTEREVQRLDYLVRQKIAFNNQILDALAKGGTNAGADLVNTGRGRLLRDSIVTVLNYLDNARQARSKGIISNFEASGKKAFSWGLALAIIACAVVVAAFLYIVSQSQHQRKVIESLNESERRIKEAAYLKEQFITNMSHEIRTPMNAIIGFTNLLRRSQLDATQREYVQNIHSAGDNLLALVNDILDLSKIEAGMMHLEETRFSIRSLAASVAAMFMDKMEEKGLRFYSEIDEDVPDILAGDAVRLTQVLVNLLGNAVKFTRTGSIWLKVQLRQQNDDKVDLLIMVQDTGIGISPEKQQTIFNRFQQAEADTTRRYGGTGLGLSIVKQLVELQGGSVEVESQQGAGTTFTVGIGYRIPDISEVESAGLVSDVPWVAPEQLHLLVAEDNLMNQQLMRHLMRNWGFHCTIVSNGLQAVEQLRQKRFLLVLMDIQMPEMDGYVATSVIRTELGMDVPIIAMTAHAMIGEKEKCLQLGMNDYLSKPIKENELYNLIARYAQATAIREQEQAGNNGDGHSHSFSILNLDYLRQLSGGDEAFEKEMMAQFATQVPDELQQLQQAFAAGNMSQLKSVAHTLKSTLGYMGLSDLVRHHLDGIEHAARDGRTEGVGEQIAAVTDVAQQALAELNDHLNR